MESVAFTIPSDVARSTVNKAITFMFYPLLLTPRVVFWNSWLELEIYIVINVYIYDC